MTKLTTFTAENSQRTAGDLDIVEHTFNGPHIGIGHSIGTAKQYFGDALVFIRVGQSQGEDAARGAYDWWPLMIADEKVGELRDDANGLTIHVNHKKTHPSRTNYARKVAKAAGYYVREGSYQGTTDDRLGRWYFGHEDDNGFRPYGAGHPTQKAAWESALEHAQQTERA